MAKLFISYSHADEPLRNELEKHLSSMRREGIISAWHDRKILPGSNIDVEIDEHLRSADIALMLVSADFLNSDYCSEKELARALELHAQGKLRVIPIILRDCDWHASPLGKLNALPMDGRPVTSQQDQDKAFADIARGIRRLLTATARATALSWAPPASKEHLSSTGPAAKAQLRRKLTDVDRDNFVHSAFDTIANHFEVELRQLQENEDGVETRFRRIDANCFTAMVYQDGRCVAQCSIRLDGVGGRQGGNILFAFDASVRAGSYNESLHAGYSEDSLFLEALGIQWSDTKQKQLSAHDAAALLWELLLRNAH